jgi:hypothetical protein
MWQHLRTFYASNSLQIFHFCCIHGNERKKSKPCCRTLFEVKRLLGNAGNDEENNCKPDHNRSELLGHWLLKDKLSKSFLIFKINEFKAAPFEPPYLQI